jgi:hypothetical protein
MAGTVVKEKRETGTFQKISTGDGIDVYFTQSDSYSVVVEADEKYIDLIVTEVKGETLVVKRKEKMRRHFIFNSRLKVHVSAPALTGVSSGGGSDFHAEHLKCDGSFQMNVSSGSDVHIANLSVAGDADISASSGSDCHIKNLQTRNCKLSSSSGSDLHVEISASGNLEASASSGSDLYLGGKADKVEVSASSGSDVDIKKLTYSTINTHQSSGGDVNR